MIIICVWVRYNESDEDILCEPLVAKEPPS